ncbi:DNA-damage-repair/toleration protein [Acrasis kona]|uniref:DNA-damage-repair/toleration protein n=1 Tax=Acrasis kona TaxID=1008807 RepID=A0AAW2ZG34_9EUKA
MSLYDDLPSPTKQNGEDKLNQIQTKQPQPIISNKTNTHLLHCNGDRITKSEKPNPPNSIETPPQDIKPIIVKKKPMNAMMAQQLRLKQLHTKAAQQTPSSTSSVALLKAQQIKNNLNHFPTKLGDINPYVGPDLYDPSIPNEYEEYKRTQQRNEI